MSEEDVRDGLRDAVAGEPPLVFDPDELVATARRQTKRRRALVSVGVATTVVAVAAVAVPFALGIPRGNDGVTVGSAPATTTTTTTAQPRDIEWPPPGVEPAQYTAEQLSGRGKAMRAHLTTRFAAVVPEATAVEVQPFGGEAAGSVSDGQTYLNAFTRFTLHGVPYAVDVQAIAPGAAPSPEEQCGERRACEVEELPDGSWLLITDDSQGESRIASAIHYRDDGAVVRATGYNYDPTGQTAARYAPAVPLTIEQLTALATDPELGL
ncbi:hypothetical protein [Actinophytocola sp. KF-1]